VFYGSTRHTAAEGIGRRAQARHCRGRASASGIIRSSLGWPKARRGEESVHLNESAGPLLTSGTLKQVGRKFGEASGCSHHAKDVGIEGGMAADRERAGRKIGKEEIYPGVTVCWLDGPSAVMACALHSTSSLDTRGGPGVGWRM